MPNWCDNYIGIKGNREEVIRCIEGMKGKKAIYKEEIEEEFNEVETYTFNATLEVPKEVLEKGYVDSGYSWQKENWGCKWDMLYKSEGELDFILDKLRRGESLGKDCDLGLKVESEKCEEKINKEDVEIEFYVVSPWNPVEGWVRALNVKHRNLEFRLDFEVCEEGFKGKYIFKKLILLK